MLRSSMAPVNHRFIVPRGTWHLTTSIRLDKVSWLCALEQIRKRGKGGRHVDSVDHVGQQSGQERLIVALDVPTHERALELVDQLDNVFLFKVGLELLLAGNLPDLVRAVQVRRQNRGGVFVDLKTAGDIGNTLTSMIRQLQKLSVMFLTLAESVSPAITLNSIRTIRAAREPSPYPQILMVREQYS